MAPRALNSRLKVFAERILPNCILNCLDPVQDLINSEIKRVADRLQDGQTILDAGAGEARHRPYFKRGRYLALDAGYGDSAWDYSKLDIRGDLAKIPLRNSTVDCVLCMVVLEHTQNPRDVLLEFARILKSAEPLLWWFRSYGKNIKSRTTISGLRAMECATYSSRLLFASIG